MKSALIKDIFKEIRSTAGRFIAIFAIVALGVGFFAGLKATTPDMKATADEYFDRQKLMDIRLLSTFGFTDEDIAALEKQPGVAEVMPTYGMDALLDMPDGTKAVKVHAMDFSQAGGMNNPVLTEGRLPAASDECLMDAHSLALADSAKIGDTITVSQGNTEETQDLFAQKSFTVVGMVNSPYYISFQRGNTSIGNGKISSYIFIPTQAVDSEYYTEVFATVDGAAALNTYSDEYKDLVDARVTELESFGKTRAQLRYDDIKAEAQDKIDEAEQKLQDAKQKLADGQAELDGKNAEYKDAQAEFEDKKSEAQQQLADARQKIADGESAIADAKEQISANQSKLDEGEAEYAAQSSEFEQQTAAAQAQIEQLKQAGRQEEAAALQAQADALKPQLDQKQAELDEAAGQIAATQQQLDEAQAKLDATAEEARAQLDAARQKLDSGRAQLQEGKAKLASSEADLAQGKVDYEEAQQTADTQIADAQSKLDEAKQKLADAQTEIDDGNREVAEKEPELADAKQELEELEPPEWYVLTRDTNPGYVGYGSDADRVGAVSSVFPVFFFLVAALVCLTTMTRMVEEQRTQIGVLKALGYSRGAVAAKFIGYALIASIAGSVAGLSAGFWIFPTAVFNAYSIMYTMPPIIAAFQPDLALMASGGAIACTVLAALWACMNELMAVPAELIRPKSPPAGKRVFLERITGLWKRLNFTQKVTVRNLFRYKKRFFMTVIGIGGCAALMLTGFGLRDSIVGIVSRQFTDIHRYDATITIEDPSNSGGDTELNALLDDVSREHIYVSQQPVTAKKNGKSLEGYAFVSEDAARLNDFVDFKDRASGERVAFPAEGVVVVEKLANALGLKVGDTFTLTKGDTQSKELKVGGITENYVYNYVYMTEQDYAAAYGKPEYKEILMKTEEGIGEAEESAISTQLLAQPGVEAVSFTTKISRDFGDIMKSLDSVVWLLIICANLLAFIVLYNLVNINITERMREIATIKVLGFYSAEVAAYVYRENIALTAIGTLLGLVGGVFLHGFVVSTTEVDVVMFERNILPMSYVYSAALTFGFAFVVNFLMNFRLRKISMVESLKSTE